MDYDRLTMIDDQGIDLDKKSYPIDNGKVFQPELNKEKNIVIDL